MRVRKILALILFCCILISALFSGCGSTSQSQSSSKTNETQTKQETGAAGSYSVTDLTGARITFSSKPERILTFSMYTDQIVLGLVTSDHLVGINTLLDDPVLSNIIPIAKRIPKKIGNPGAEEVLSMKPDLVIVSDWTQAEKISVKARFWIYICRILMIANSLAERRSFILSNRREGRIIWQIRGCFQIQL